MSTPMSSAWDWIARGVRKLGRRVFRPKVVTVAGVRLRARGPGVSRQVTHGLYRETYEEPERLLLGRFLAPGDRVLEVGGGIGFISLLCARVVGADQVLTYEANAAMGGVIRDNFALNGLVPNLRNRAITGRGGPVTFFVSGNIVSSSLYRREGGVPATVESDSLESVLEEIHPTVLVMDIEGAEVEVLGSSRLPGIRAVMLELHPHVTGEAAVARLRGHLGELGFREAGAIHKSALFLRR